MNTHRERIRVDGELIDREAFVRLISSVQGILARLDDSPTTYELGTLLAFQHFAGSGVQLAVVEVGLGGRLDATNVLDAELAVITSISYDHMEVLGSTLSAIAAEKAGIIKPGKPVIVPRQPAEAMSAIRRRADEMGSEVVQAAPVSGAENVPPIVSTFSASAQRTQCFSFDSGRACIPLLGAHQLTNASVAIAAARQLGFGDQAIERGLDNVRWPGRLEIAQEQPLIVLDGAHNVDSMGKLAAAVRRHFTWRRLRIIAGFSADKDITGMAPILNDLADEIVLTQSKHARSADPAAIRGFFRDARMAGLAEALHDPPDFTLITGSLYLVGDARLELGLISAEDQDEL